MPLERGAGDQRRGHAPDARVRRGRRASCGGLRALRPGLDRVRGRHPRRPVLRVRPRRRAELQQLLRAVEVRGRAAGPLAHRAAVHDPAPEHRRRRPQQRLDRPRSTSSTGRCARSRAGCSRRCRRSRRRRSTSSRSTTSPTRSTSCARPRAAIGETYHLTAGADASTIAEIAAAREPLLPPAAAAGAPAGRVRDRSTAAPPRRRRSRQGAMYFPYFSIDDRVRRAVTRGAPGAAGDQRLAAARLHGAAARLRDPQPLGQAPDRAASTRAALIALNRPQVADRRCSARHRPFPPRRPRRARHRVARVPDLPAQRGRRMGGRAARIRSVGRMLVPTLRAAVAGLPDARSRRCGSG